MAERGADYLIQLGLDTSRLKKEYPKVFKEIEKATKKQSAVEKKQLDIKNKNLALKQKEIALAKRQLTIEKQIRAAEAKGARGFSNIRTLAGKGDPLSISKAELATKAKLLSFEKKLKAETIQRREEEAKASRISRISKAETQAYAENARRGRASNRDPMAVSARSKEGLSARLGHEIARSHSDVTLPEFQAQIAASKKQLRGLRDELKKATSVGQVTKLRERFKDINNEIRETVRSQRTLNRELKKGSAIGTKFAGSMKSMALSMVSAYAAINVGREVFRVGKEFDAMQAGLLAASDNAAAAKDNFKFLLDTAKRLGTDVESGVRGFNRLGVSMRGAGFEAEDIKQVFTATQEAAATFQLSADKTNLVMLAMSQMSSKGKISSEELNLLAPCTAMCM